jgi:hypothetical protein
MTKVTLQLVALFKIVIYDCHIVQATGCSHGYA